MPALHQLRHCVSLHARASPAITLPYFTCPHPAMIVSSLLLHDRLALWSCTLAGCRSPPPGSPLLPRRSASCCSSVCRQAAMLGRHSCWAAASWAGPDSRQGGTAAGGAAITPPPAHCTLKSWHPLHPLPQYFSRLFRATSFSFLDDLRDVVQDVGLGEGVPPFRGPQALFWSAQLCMVGRAALITRLCPAAFASGLYQRSITCATVAGQVVPALHHADRPRFCLGLPDSVRQRATRASRRRGEKRTRRASAGRDSRIFGTGVQQLPCPSHCSYRQDQNEHKEFRNLGTAFVHMASTGEGKGIGSKEAGKDRTKAFAKSAKTPAGYLAEWQRRPDSPEQSCPQPHRRSDPRGRLCVCHGVLLCACALCTVMMCHGAALVAVGTAFPEFHLVLPPHPSSAAHGSVKPSDWNNDQYPGAGGWVGRAPQSSAVLLAAAPLLLLPVSFLAP